MERKIIFSNKKGFEEHLRRINRKKPISMSKVEHIIQKWDERYPNKRGSVSIKFFHVTTFCFILLDALEDELFVITVTCSEKASKTRKKRYQE